jgi:hypothetical protein
LGICQGITDVFLHAFPVLDLRRNVLESIWQEGLRDTAVPHRKYCEGNLRVEKNLNENPNQILILFFFEDYPIIEKVSTSFL